MGNALFSGEKTIFAEATVADDGSFHLNDPSAFAFRPGQKVTLTISAVSEDNEGSRDSLRGTVTRYDDPFGSAASPEEWEALQ